MGIETKVTPLMRCDTCVKDKTKNILCRNCRIFADGRAEIHKVYWKLRPSLKNVAPVKYM